MDRTSLKQKLLSILLCAVMTFNLGTVAYATEPMRENTQEEASQSESVVEEQQDIAPEVEEQESASESSGEEVSSTPETKSDKEQGTTEESSEPSIEDGEASSEPEKPDTEALGTEGDNTGAEPGSGDVPEESDPQSQAPEGLTDEELDALKDSITEYTEEEKAVLLEKLGLTEEQVLTLETEEKYTLPQIGLISIIKANYPFSL